MGGTVLEGSGLGIVPYYYEKAKVHFLDSIRIEEAAEEFQEDEKEVVIIKPEVISKIGRAHV